MTMENGAFEVKSDLLTSLIKAIDSSTKMEIHLGIISKSKKRTDGIDNATIGEFHEQEFGSYKAPKRSFLRMPVELMMDKYLERAIVDKDKTIKDTINNKSLEKLMEQIAAVAHTVVMDAFKTGGFGNWKPSDFTHKKVHQTLVETQQLRDSIAWEVKK